MIRSRNPLITLALHILLGLLATVSILPFVWVVCASVKTGDDLFNHTFLPPGGFDRLTVENFVRICRERPLISWVVNSTFLASTHTVIVVLLSSLGGFALAKYDFPGKRPLMLLMLATMLLPGQVILPSLYEQVDRLGWVNNYAGILVPGAVSVFGMFLFRQAMRGVPDELIAAARVDGCSELRVWWDVALPCVRPMVGAYTLMAFLGTWNSFLWPQLVLKDESKYTLPIGLSTLTSLQEYQADYGVIMAGTVISIAPVMVVFLLLQRELI
ncbi:MAG: carbohydrate ABC transporter permease, partial [Phycisphaerae bacterium]|nr:carbohydrate ABC transporter permease [Phycisphaerae bacterium]